MILQKTISLPLARPPSLVSACALGPPHNFRVVADSGVWLIISDGKCYISLGPIAVPVPVGPGYASGAAVPFLGTELRLSLPPGRRTDPTDRRRAGVVCCFLPRPQSCRTSARIFTIRVQE